MAFRVHMRTAAVESGMAAAEPTDSRAFRGP